MTTAYTPPPSSSPWHGLDDLPAGWGPCVVTLGVFDGVHRGHANLIDRAVRVGRHRGVPTVLTTFHPHPARVVGISRDTSVLASVERRSELARELGVAAVLVLPFTPELAQESAASFVRRVLIDGLRACDVVVGNDFTFGHRSSGTVDTLRKLGLQHGFGTHNVGLLQVVGAPCSSTHIRECLQRGHVRAAARSLGRPHRVDGYCDHHGQLHLAAGTAVPAVGSYTGRTTSGRLVEVRIPPEGKVFLRGHSPLPSPMSIEFLDRQDD